ncbi:MAG: recombinase family protein [Chloroflexota bacterium]
MKAAAIYARVSTADQVKGTSLDGQVQSCQEYARENGYTVIKVMQEDMSGARLDRPKLGELRDMAGKHEIEALIVFDPDRLSRSMPHTMLLMEEFERSRAGILFVNAPREDTPEGKMLFGMKSLFAEYERTKIMERTRRGKERRAREGKVLSSWTVPLGYAYIVGEGRYEIIPAEAQLVTRIFDWYATEGASLRMIAARLTSMGIPTKRGAATWSPSTIRAILTNETYGGTWYYNKNEAVLAKRRRYADGRKPRNEKSGHLVRPREEWIGVQVPAIIDPDLYPLVAAQMERNARLQKRNCKREYLLRGLLLCRQCGRRLTARHTPTYIQYYCTGKYDAGLRDSCKCTWPNAQKLDARVWEKIAALLSDEEQIAGILESQQANRETERARQDAELGALLSSEISVKTEETRLLDAYAKSIIDIDQLQERMSGIRKQKAALAKMRAEIEERVQASDAAQGQQAMIMRHVALAKKGLPTMSFEDRRAALEAISFKGVVDGETDSLYITGCLSIRMSISGKDDGPGDGEGKNGREFQLRTESQRSLQRVADYRQSNVPAFSARCAGTELSTLSCTSYIATRVLPLLLDSMPWILTPPNQLVYLFCRACESLSLGVSQP